MASRLWRFHNESMLQGIRTFSLKTLSPIRTRPASSDLPRDSVDLAVAPGLPAGEKPTAPLRPSLKAALALGVVTLGGVMGGIPAAVAAPQVQLQVQARTSRPTLAVIDSFEGNRSHGSLVDALLNQKQGTLRLPHQIREDVTGLAFTEGQAEFNQYITDLMQELPAQALTRVNAQLQTIAGDPHSSVRTVNLSLAINKAARFQLLDQVLQQDLEARARMYDFLGLPATASEQEFSQKLVDKLENLYDSSPATQKARQEYLATLSRLDQRNITVVVAAGNEGELQAQLASRGVKTSASFYENLFASSQVITVGAVDQAHQVWNESNPGAQVLARGVAVPIPLGRATSCHDGTSFAAPQIASLIEQMKDIRPGLTRTQILDLLRRASDPVAGDPILTGSGEVNFSRALALTKASLHR